MSQEDLDLAASLIKQKKYPQARAILQTIPHDPKAREWLAKLDQIDPQPISPAPIPNKKDKRKSRDQQVVIVKEKKRGGCLSAIAGLGFIGMGIVGCFFVVVCGGIALAISSADDASKDNDSESESPSSSETARLESAFLEVPGIQSCGSVVVTPNDDGFIVYAECETESGFRSQSTAEAMFQASLTSLTSSAVDFTSILNDGNQATDYSRFVIDDEWIVTDLSTSPG